MRIQTNNPIIVNGVKESRPSEYLSAEGVEVISSKDPIIVDGKRISNPTWYLSAEGTEVISSKDPIIIDGKRISNPTWYLSADGDERNAMNNIEMSDGTLGNGKSSSSNSDEFYDADGDNYSYIDKNNSSEVKAFQDWLDAKGVKFVGATNAARNNGRLLNKGTGYGTFGPSTTNAYAVYGSQWEASRTPTVAPTPAPAPAPAAPPAAPMQVVTAGVPTIPTGTQPTTQQIEEQKKKGVFWNKAKGVWVKAKEAGVLDWLAMQLGITPPPPAVEEPSPRERKMGAGVTTALVIGAVAVVGLIIYSQSKKSN